APSGNPRIVASALLDRADGGSAIVARELDEGFIADLEDRVAMSVEIVSAASGIEAATNRPSTSRVVHRTVVPLSAARPDEGYRLVVSMSDEPLAASVRDLRLALLASTAAVLLVAVLGGLVATRVATTSLRTLAGAARRIGEGDLDTPVPGVGGLELGG